MTGRPQRKRSTPIGKFTCERCVCAPHKCSAGTWTSPRASSSIRNSLSDCETHNVFDLSPCRHTFRLFRRSRGQRPVIRIRHFLPATQCDLLVSVERGCAQPAGAADYGPDPGSFTAAEDAAKQSAGSRPDRRMSDAFSAPATGLDRAFDVDLLAGRCIVKLNNFGINRARRPSGITRRSKRSIMLVRPLTFPDISISVM